MKKLSRTIAVLSMLFASYSVFAADAALAAKKEACFRAHSQLMGKPALTNIEACWRAHGYKTDAQ